MKFLDEIKQSLYATFAAEIQNKLGLPSTPVLHEGDIIKTILDVIAEYLWTIELEQQKLKFYADYTKYTGEELDAKAAEYGLTRFAAQPAVGELKFIQQQSGSGIIQSGLEIVSGTKRYKVIQNIAFDGNSGLTYTVPIQAVFPGTEGNAIAEEIQGQIYCDNVLFTYINPLPIAGGRDIESDADLRARLTTRAIALNSNATQAYWLDKLYGLSYENYIIKSVNIYEDFLTYSNTAYIDIGVSNYSGFIVPKTEVHLITDNICPRIFLTVGNIWPSGDTPKVYWKYDYYDKNAPWVLLTPYANDPTAPWDYALNLATGEIIFNLNSGSQAKLSGNIPGAGNGISSDFYYLSEIYQLAQQTINSERILGLNLIVRPCEIKLIDLQIKIYTKKIVDSATFTPELQNKIISFVESIPVGQDFVLQQLIAYLLNQYPEEIAQIEFLGEYVNVSKITAAPNEKIRINTVRITYV
jgi:hypothetical protein